MRRGLPKSATVTYPLAVPATTSTTSGQPATLPETRAIYRALLVRRLHPSEAANLTAFLCGIPVGKQPWKIEEVNRLLFLRELQIGGRFRPTRGE
jgi:hypothetical protein